MKKIRFWFLFPLISLGIAYAAQQAPSNMMDSTLSFNGFGPIQVGMTAKQVEAITHFHLNATSMTHLKPIEQAECQSSFQKTAKGSYSIMFSYGKVVLVNIMTPGFKTDSGLQLGDPESKIKSTYPGQYKMEPHQYEPKGHYFTIQSKAPQFKNRALRFETDGKKIIQMAGGASKQIQYNEGCE
jgi:hypothetical protein